MVWMAAPIDLILLRGLVADLPLREGALLGAKVVERQGDRGLLAFAGARVWATLPDDVPEGTRLRLRVTEASVDRVTMQVVAPPAGEASSASQTAAAPPPMWTGSVALPGGAHAHLIVTRESEGSGGSGGDGAPLSVLLRYDSPELGRMDMLVSGEGVSISAASGEPADRARAAAGVLRSALVGATGRAATVTVHDRTETVDLHA